MDKIPGAAIVAVLFAVSGAVVLLSCSGQSSEEVSKDLAQKLTDSFEFENGKKVSGDKPVEHKADALYPQVTGLLNPPSNIKSGDSFSLVLLTDFVTTADITGAVVAVENKGVYAGEYVDVTAQVVNSDGRKKMTLTGKLNADFGGDTASFTVKIAMHKADGQVGNYYEWNLDVNGGGEQTTEIKNPTAEQKQNAQAMATDVLSFGNTIKSLESGFSGPLATLQTLIDDTFNLAQSLVTTTGARSTMKALSLMAECGSKNGDTITYECNETYYSAVGTIKIVGDLITIDMQLGQNESASSVKTAVFKGSIDVGGASVDGTISIATAETYNGVNSKFSVKNTYSNVAFAEAEPCPTGGSETTAITEFQKGDASEPLFRFDVAFGPSCGDMKMTKTISIK